MENELITNIRYEKSEEFKEIYCALIKFQSEVPVIFKANFVVGKDKKPKYAYADMADIKNTIQPFMSKNELGIIQPLSYENDFDFVVTEIIHSSGQWIRSELSAQVSINIGYMSQIQAIGSVSTYLKRYAMSSLLGLVTDQDNDGNVDKEAQKKVDAAKHKEDLLCFELRESIKNALDKITDSDRVLRGEKWLKNDRSSGELKERLIDVESAVDTQNTTYQTQE